jgi:hypothetical protein
MQAIKARLSAPFIASDQGPVLAPSSVTRLEGLSPLFADRKIDAKHHLCLDDAGWHLHRTSLATLCDHQQPALVHSVTLLERSLQDRRWATIGKSIVTAFLGSERPRLSVKDLRVLHRVLQFLDTAVKSLGLDQATAVGLLNAARKDLLMDSPEVLETLGRAKLVLAESRCDARTAWRAAVANDDLHVAVVSKLPSAPPSALDSEAERQSADSAPPGASADAADAALVKLKVGPATRQLIQLNQTSPRAMAIAVVNGAPEDITLILDDASTTPEWRQGLAQAHVREILGLLHRYSHSEGSNLDVPTANMLRFRLMAYTAHLLDRSFPPSGFSFEFAPVCEVDAHVSLMATWVADCVSAERAECYPLMAATDAVRQLLAPHAVKRLRGDPAADLFIQVARIAARAKQSSQRELHALAHCLKQVPLHQLGAAERALLEPGFELLCRLARKHDPRGTLLELEALAPQISPACAALLSPEGERSPAAVPMPAPSAPQSAFASLAVEPAPWPAWVAPEAALAAGQSASDREPAAARAQKMD